MPTQLARRLVKGAMRRYINLMDKVISRYVGGESSPAFFDANRTYPQLLNIDANYQQIRGELAALLPRTEAMGLVHETINGHPEVKGWRVLYIYVRGMHRFPNQEHFPHTIAVLDSIPNVVDAWFSALEPGKSIPAHRGIYRGFLRYHTAFKVPASNPPRIRVKDEFYTWKEGESVMFDDRHEHEVYNESDETRLVMIVDVMRPLPWFLHMFNVVAINFLRRMLIEPAIKGGSLGIKGDVWEAQRLAGV